jgi:hypothetical protein
LRRYISVRQAVELLNGSVSAKLLYALIAKGRLRLNGVSSQRTRLYDSEFYFWSETQGRWIKMGTGRWTD